MHGAVTKDNIDAAAVVASCRMVAAVKRAVGAVVRRVVGRYGVRVISRDEQPAAEIFQTGVLQSRRAGPVGVAGRRWIQIARRRRGPGIVVAAIERRIGGGIIAALCLGEHGSVAGSVKYVGYANLG